MIRRLSSSPRPGSRRVRRGRLVREGYANVNVYELRRLLGAEPVRRIMQRGQRNVPRRQGNAKVNSGAMWKLMADKLYGSQVDAPAVATREALQNSRDAIDKAWKAGLIEKTGGRFEVDSGTQEDGRRWMRWTDNGIGMSSDIVFDKFLSLGDTTKTSGEDAGGFGIAKAIILGLSTTFRWTMHTLGSRYEANGFDTPVREYEAESFLQGTELTIYDISKDYEHFWQTKFGTDAYWSPRQRVVLASNNLRPQRSHAGVRLYYQGAEVQAALSGRGALLVDRAETADKTKVDVRAYKRSDKEGRLYVRLAGLLQYTAGLRGAAPFDVVVDIFTRLAAGDDGYPLTAARTALDGATERRVDAFVEEILSEALSATKEKEETTTFGLREGDEDAVEAGLQATISRYEGMLGDPRVVQRLKLADGTGGLLRNMQFEYQLVTQRHREFAEARAQRARARNVDRDRQREEKAEQEWWTTSVVKPSPPPRRKTEAGLSIQAMQRIKVKQKKKRGGVRSNPYAGIAALHINANEFDARRLRTYFTNTDRWINLALVWRMTCRLVLNESGRPDMPFDVGFVFADGVAAMYERREGGADPILSLNPDWFSRSVMKAYKDRPLNVAAVLHSKACHEIAHMKHGDKWGHSEIFVAHRESLADQTVGILYPLGSIVEGMLGIKPAPTPEAKELARLKGQLERLRKTKGRRAPMQQACPEALALRRRLLR